MTLRLAVHRTAYQAATFTPDTTVNKVRAVMLLLISLLLIGATITSLIGPARAGRTRQVWDVVGATLVALIPAAIGIAGTGLAFAAAFLGWAVPFITTK
jgi:hypothetical protein